MKSQSKNQLRKKKLSNEELLMHTKELTLLIELALDDAYNFMYKQPASVKRKYIKRLNFYKNIFDSHKVDLFIEDIYKREARKS